MINERRDVFIVRGQIARTNLINRLQENEVSFPIHIGQLDTDLPRIEVVRASLSEEEQALTPKFRDSCGGDLNKFLYISLLGSGLWGNSVVVDGYTDENFDKILHTYALISSQDYRNLHERGLVLFESQKGSESVIRQINGERDIFISKNENSLLDGLKKELERVFSAMN